MEIFAVSKEGVYRHEVVGVYSTLEKAIDRAKKVIKDERDDYHEFDVLRFNLDEDVEDGVMMAKIVRKKEDVLVRITSW